MKLEKIDFFRARLFCRISIPPTLGRLDSTWLDTVAGMSEQQPPRFAELANLLGSPQPNAPPDGNLTHQMGSTLHAGFQPLHPKAEKGRRRRLDGQGRDEDIGGGAQLILKGAIGVQA